MTSNSDKPGDAIVAEIPALADVADETSFQRGAAAPGLGHQIKEAAHRLEERLKNQEPHAEPFSWSHQLDG